MVVTPNNIVKRHKENNALINIDRAISIGLSIMHELDVARGQIVLAHRTGMVIDIDSPSNAFSRHAKSFDVAVDAAFAACKALNDTHDNSITEIAVRCAADCWKDPTTQHLKESPELVAVFARVLKSWIDDAMRYANDVDFYRGLLDECAAHIGKEAYTDDAGGVHEDPIRLKIPELVKRLLIEPR